MERRLLAFLVFATFAPYFLFLLIVSAWGEGGFRCASAAALFALLILALGYPALVITSYNLCFHPLRKVPGPKLWAATLLPAYYNRIRGTAIFRIKELHDQYGPVVRVAP